MTLPPTFQPPADPLERLEDNPYPIFTRFRRFAGPMMWAQQHWFILGHPEAMAVLRDTRLSSAPAAAGAAGADPGAAGDAAAQRARRRGLVQQTFTPAFVERFRPHTQKLVHALLDEAAADADLDLIADFATPLALLVAADVLGLRPEQAQPVSAWVTGITNSLAPPRGHRMLPGGGGPVIPTDEVRASVAAAIDAHRDRPHDDLIGLLAEADGPDGRLDADELLDVCLELLVSAHLSTVDLIGNGVHALLGSPLQAERLRAEPHLITTGVEELLRYDPPIQRITRFATADVELGGKTMERGQTVVILVGAANRDPEVFEAPDSLDLSRDPNHHVTFGRGMRFCLGAPLARLETQVAIGSLITRFPALRLAGTLRRRKVRGARGFAALPLAL